MTTSPKPTLHVSFVCTGNICRSPMAEVIVASHLAKAGLSTAVRVSSCGIGGWHEGDRADHRALTELRNSGYDGSAHRAHQIDEVELAADLLIALDTGHRAELLAAGVPPERIRLLRSFDPASPPEASVADPYYGGPEDFLSTREQIEAASPGLLAWARDTLTQRGWVG